MRNTLRNALLVTTAAAGLATGITLAAAQGMGGAGTGGGGAATSGEHRQGPSGGGHAQSTQGPSGGGHAQTQGGTTHEQLGGTRERGHAFGEERNERGKPLGEQKGTKQLGQSRDERHERFGREDRGERLGKSREERGERFGTTRESGRTGFAREREGRSVELSSEQRTRMHDVFVRDRDRFNRFRVSRVEFDLRPGVRVPRSFHLFTVPLELVGRAAALYFPRGSSASTKR